MENISLYNGSLTTLDSNACFFNTPNYDYTSYWTYIYCPAEDYKIMTTDKNVVVDILVAGVEKENIKAWIEGDYLKVSTSTPNWSRTYEISVSLDGYSVDKDPENINVGLKNGVLRVEFLKKDSKKLLRIN